MEWNGSNVAYQIASSLMNNWPSEWLSTK